MVASISAVTSPLTWTPVAARFSSPVSRSNTISAPTLRSDSEQRRAQHLVDGSCVGQLRMASEHRADGPEPADLVEGAAELRLEQDDRRDHDRLGAVVEDELEEAQMQELRRPADREDDREAEEQLHRLRAPDQLEELIEQEGDHEDVETVPPAQALEEEVRVAQEVAHAATPTPSAE